MIYKFIIYSYPFQKYSKLVLVISKWRLEGGAENNKSIFSGGGLLIYSLSSSRERSNYLSRRIKPLSSGLAVSDTVFSWSHSWSMQMENGRLCLMFNFDNLHWKYFLSVNDSMLDLFDNKIIKNGTVMMIFIMHSHVPFYGHACLIISTYQWLNFQVYILSQHQIWHHTYTT